MDESGSKGGRTRRPAAKAPAAAPSKKSAPGKAPPARRVAASKTPAEPKEPVAVPIDRDEMVRIAAYFRAERRGFAPGYEVADWLEAQAEVDGLTGTKAAPKPRKTPARKRTAD